MVQRLLLRQPCLPPALAVLPELVPPLHKVRTKSEQPAVKEEDGAGAGDGKGAAGADDGKGAAEADDGKRAALEEEGAAEADDGQGAALEEEAFAGAVPTLIYFSCI